MLVTSRGDFNLRSPLRDTDVAELRLRPSLEGRAKDVVLEHIEADLEGEAELADDVAGVSE